MRENTDQETPNTDTFYAVIDLYDQKKLSHFDKFQKWRAFTTSLNGSKIQANVINTNNWGKMHLLGHHLT